MKVALLSESKADEAAIRILVEAILGQAIEPPGNLPLRARGYFSVRDSLPTIIKHLHYRTDAEALVVVVDSNGSPVHDARHDEPDGRDPACRLCLLRSIIDDVRRQLRPVSNRAELKVAIGLATPSVEAWYRWGLDPHATEVAWARDLEGGAQAPRVIRRLKRDVYGTDRPSLSVETKRAAEQAQRLTESLEAFEAASPNGFGPLARAVRAW